MFSVDIDHLNILVILILAFFSFRAYHPNQTLSISYQDSENQEENANINQNDQVQMKDQNQPNLDTQIVQIQGNLVQHQSGHDQIQKQVSQNFNKQVINEKVQRQNQMENQNQRNFIIQAALKNQDAESTIMNRQSPVQSDLYLNNSDEEELSKSQISDSSNSSSSQDDSEGANASNRIQKRKKIQKEKKKAKRNNKRQELAEQQADFIKI